MKVKKLGLPRRRGLVYAVAADGRVLATEQERTTVVARIPRAKLDPEFLHFIDDDGDLAREYSAETPEHAQGRRDDRLRHQTEPASRKLDRPKLFKAALSLVSPPRSQLLSGTGYAPDERSERIYAAEFRRLERELTHMFGKPEHPDDAIVDTISVWTVRGVKLALVLLQEDQDLPYEISLMRYEDLPGSTRQA